VSFLSFFDTLFGLYVMKIEDYFYKSIQKHADIIGC